MKKFFSVLLVALVLVSTASCNKKADKGSAQGDSIAKMLGDAMGSNLKFGVDQDSANANKFDKDAFLKGLESVVTRDTSATDNSYLGGVNYGFQVLSTLQQLEQETGSKIDRRKFLAAMREAFNSKRKLTQEEVQQKGMDFQNLITRVANAKKASDPNAVKNLKAGQAFAAQAKAKGFQQTASGVLYKISAPGTGENFKKGQTVMVSYVGKHIDGKVFDQSQQPVPMTLDESQLIKGFVEALQLLKPGAKATVVIPANLAYGEQGNQAIGPNETLIFEIEAVGLQKK